MLRRRLFPQNHNRLGSLQVTLAILIFVDYAHELLARLAAYRHLYRAQAFYVPEENPCYLLRIAGWIRPR
jgi:hypothetical protein